MGVFGLPEIVFFHCLGWCGRQCRRKDQSQRKDSADWRERREQGRRERGRGVNRPSHQTGSGRRSEEVDGWWVVGKCTLLATIDDSLSKSSTMGGALWQKQKQWLQPLSEITCLGTLNLEPEPSLWLPTPSAPSEPMELRCYVADRPRTLAIGLPWAPRSPTDVCMLYGRPCSLQGVSSPFSSLCS